MTTLTADLLRQLMNCPATRAEVCFPVMVEAMRRFDITSPARIACFLTQVKWESGGLVYFAELASGDAYEGRVSLGNTHEGDGPRYKGSGPIQVTGRSNFEAAQRALDAAGIGIDIVANPDLARTVQYGFWISCWWWEAHGGNEVSERLPLSYASLCCGRLVNRGAANSPKQAQDEAQRIDAFRHISAFGDLALPGPTTTPPAEAGTTTSTGDEDMALSADEKAWIVQAIHDGVNAGAAGGNLRHELVMNLDRLQSTVTLVSQQNGLLGRAVRQIPAQVAGLVRGILTTAGGKK